MNSWDKLLLLLWKNFILQKRRPIATTIELVLPILFAGILMIIRRQIDVQHVENSTVWESFKLGSLPEYSSKVVPPDKTWTVGYAPDSDFVKDVMKNCETIFSAPSKTEVEKTCGFDQDQLLADIKTILDRMENPKEPSISSTLTTLEKEAIKKLNLTKQQLTELTKTERETKISAAIGKYLKTLQGCIVGVRYPGGVPGGDTSVGGTTGGGTSVGGTTGGGTLVAGLKMFIELLERLPSNTKIKVKGFKNEDDFEQFTSNADNMNHFLAGVMFRGDLTKKSKEMTTSYRFHADPMNKEEGNADIFGAVRNTWRTDERFPEQETLGPRNNDSIYGGRPRYFKEGFLALMHCVNLRLSEKLTVSAFNASPDYLTMQRFPYPPYVNDRFVIAIQNSLPFLLMLSFFYTVAIIVKSVVYEKETRMKEYMTMMGLPGWIHWLAWYLKYIIFLTISCLAVSIIYKIPVTPTSGPILPKSNVFLIFLFLLLFSSANITLGFFFSSMFDRASVAAAVGGILYGLSYMPVLFIEDRLEKISTTARLLMSILPNVALFNGCYLIGKFEAKGDGVQFSNLNLPPNVDNELTFFHVWLMLMLDAVIYMLLALYIQIVHPGQFGTPMPWYFPFTKSYWRDGSIISKEVAVETGAPTEEKGDYFEDEPTDAECVVRVKDLCKEYHNPTNGKRNKAVRGIDMNMYKNEITVLLGHNGAGKTTTMSMLTGFTPPTSGDAYVNGYSIRTDIKGVRKSMGLCPQFNILFDSLTVTEHLYFFGRLKGLDRVKAEKESEEMIKSLNLEDKSESLSMNLSGGMKRKLSVGIALSAGSKYVIMDEPTSGMDPAARRAIWDILLNHRTNCTMLLSTHFMDEADYLGNRISIMASGKLRCAGSPLFLKNKFGVGYHIVLTKTEECDVKELKELFTKHVPGALLERMSGAEVSFVLPFNSSDKFPALFYELDNKAVELGVSGYGATITTMEEVFLRVTESLEDPVENVSRSMSIKRPFRLASITEKAEVEEEEKRVGANRSFRPDENTTGLVEDIEMGDLRKGKLHSVLTKPMNHNMGVKLLKQQFYSLLLKHIIYTRRNYKIAVSQILVPIIFTFIAVMNAKFPPVVVPNIALEYELDSYGETTIMYSLNTSSGTVNAFSNTFSNQFGTLQKLDKINGNLLNAIADRNKKEYGRFSTKHLIAAEFFGTTSDPAANALFNAQAFHTSAIALAYIDQAHIREQTKIADFRLKVINDPLPRDSHLSISQAAFGSINGFFVAFNLVLGFSFLSSSFVVMYVKERANKAALLQRLTGVSPILFWLSGYLWDFFTFFIPCIFTLIMFRAASLEEYDGKSGIIFLIFFFYIWSLLPFVYSISFAFDDASTALVRLTIFNIISGLAPMITISILNLLQIDDVKDILKPIFFLIPQFCLGQCFQDIYTNHIMVNACTKSKLAEAVCDAGGFKYQENFLSMHEPGVGRPILFLFLTGVVFWIIVVLVEYDVYDLFYRKFLFSSSVEQQETPMVEDEDVVTERNRINALRNLDSDSDSDYGLVVKELTKIYKARGKSNGNFLAVDRLSFGVPPFVCFGLLGVNGAGKTTTFKMLTGDYSPTRGTAYLDGDNLENHLRKIQQKLGYCPQFDALIEQMTGEETLYMYARLRGVPEEELAHRVKSLGKILHFDQFLQAPCGNYSGGNKRKLSTAIALVGSPPVVLLDEPSSGMDPGARRMLWDAIADVRRSGKSIIITSHSMEECEALCTRLAIMVNGRFQCIGNPQHLKSRFGQSFNLELSTYGVEMRSKEIKEEIKIRFPDSVIKDGFNNVLSFDIPMTDEDGQPRQLAKTFEIMESLKSDLQLGGYTLTQATLEQVFLRLVKQQRLDD